MSSVEDILERRSERGVHRDPHEVLASVHQQVTAVSRGDAPSHAPSPPRPRYLGDARLAAADWPRSPELASDRKLPKRVVGVAAVVLVVGLGVVISQNQPSDVEPPVATEPELPSPPTEAPREPPADPLPSLVRYLPNEPVPWVEVLRFEDGYSLAAAWDPDLCVSIRDDGGAGASICAPPEHLTDTLLGFSSHVGDRPGHYISGAVGPEITHVGVTIAESGDRTIPVVGHSSFEDLRFFVLYVAPDERLEDLRTITRDGTQYPVMDADQFARMARMAERVELLGEP